MYSYYIQGFSLIQKDYGCFNNEFYFYIYIYSIGHLADISFEIQILNNEYSILIDILTLNHRNLIIIFEHILSKINRAVTCGFGAN